MGQFIVNLDQNSYGALSQRVFDVEQAFKKSIATH